MSAPPQAAALPSNLNLGCGDDIRDPRDWLNVDAYRVRDGVMVLDTNSPPWPFQSDHFTHVLWRHGPEHVPFVYRPFGNVQHRWILYDIMEEIWRVLRAGGTLEIITPSMWAPHAFEDPQHVRPFTAESFKHFTRARPESAYTTARFDLVESGYITWDPAPWGPRMGKSRMTLNEHLHARAGISVSKIPREVRTVLRKVA